MEDLALKFLCLTGEMSLHELAGQHKGPAILADDLDGMGEVWLGFLEEEDMQFSIQNWEAKIGGRSDELSDQVLSRLKTQGEISER
jgi:hypothetical protein